MTAREAPMKVRLTPWQSAARAFLKARGFRARPCLFGAVADALAAFFAEASGPFRLPLALEWFGKAEVMAVFANRTGPLGFADARRVVETLQADFPQATIEHVHVGIKILAQGGLVEGKYRRIDPETGAAVDVSGEERAALLKRACESGPDGEAAGERLARTTLDGHAVFPLPESRSHHPASRPQLQAEREARLAAGEMDE